MKPRSRGEEGVTLVEASIGAVVVFTLLFTILQFGFLAAAHIGARNGAASASRTGSIAGNSIDADYKILQSVKSATGFLVTDQIEQIIIFKATSPYSPVPSSCLSSAVDGLCNDYVGSDLNRPATDFGPGSWGADDHWAPLSRNVSRV